MDSKDYFKRAEVANRRLRIAIIFILVVVAVGQFVVIGVLFHSNSENHKLGVENQKIINSNFEVYFKCLTDDSYKIPQNTRPPQAQADKILTECADTHTKSLIGN